MVFTMGGELTVKHVCLPVLSVIMVLGNGMLIYITVRYKHLRTVTNFFIISLALSDLLMGLVFLPLLVAVEEGVLGNSYIDTHTRTCESTNLSNLGQYISNQFT